MTPLQQLVETPLAAALGWALAHSLWEGAFAALILALTLAITRSPRVRYAVACFAMLAILLGFAVTFAQFAPSGKNHAAIARTLRTAFSNGPGDPSGFPKQFGADDILPWLTPLWLAGVIFFQLRGAASWVAARRLSRRGVCAAPEAWQRRLTQLRQTLAVSQPIALLETCFAEVPVVIGHLRPVILVPIGMLTSMPAAAIEAILLHELAHIRRRDYFVNMLQTAAECLLFYHPAVWWISRVIRAERENCCDDLAVSVSGNARQYAAALTALEQNRWIENQAALAATGGNLMKRIRRLLDPRDTARVVLTPILSVGILTLVASVALIAWQAPQPPALNLPPVWNNWLTQDVAYIITDAERTSFRALKTDDERAAFIAQFWKRRDPTPDTVKNEYMEEHYRRIAWANQRFPGPVPGWKTDRGRIYIVYGPPDEIDAHPGGGPASRVPYEDWTYRHIEGVGNNINIEFVDTAGNGEYRMASDPHPETGVRVARPQ